MASKVSVSAPSEFTPKPKDKGSLGRQIKLHTNHYKLAIAKEFTVHQYDIEIKRTNQDFRGAGEEDKSIKNKSLMREMFVAFTENILPKGYENQIVYNFSKNMYSLKKFPFDAEMSYQVKLDGNIYTLDIKKINTILVDPSKYEDPVSIQILDLIFTQNFNYSHINVNRSFFKEGADFFNLGFGLQLWKGAYSSVRPSEIGLTWNVDSANAAFLISENLLKLVAQFYGSQHPFSDLKKKITEDKREGVIGHSFLELFKGREIKTNTGGFRKKIHGFGPDSNFLFEVKKGTVASKISIEKYIKERYNQVVRFPGLPCIDMGKNSYVPLEMCRTELKNKKKLDEQETAEMIKLTAVKATDRLKYIEGWIQKANIGKDPVLQQFNIQVNLRPIELGGRVLEAPDLQYGGTSQPIIVTSRTIGERGSWDHRNSKLSNPKKINKWAVLNCTRINSDRAYGFAMALVRIGKIHGIEIANPADYAEVKGRDPEQFRRSFEGLATKHKDLELVVAIFPGTSIMYNMLKTCGDLKYGILTQGVEERNVNKMQDQTLSNILLKINTKLGGRNWLLSTQNRLFAQYLNNLYDGPVMFFGMDVTHPSPNDQKITESIAACTGSFDRQGSFYGARIFAQKTPKGQAYEMIHSLNEMVLSLLQEFYRINKVFPKKMVFYRDGVSEGQFSLVLRHEMNKIREACQSVNVAYKPAITFVVVQKRHHTRLFAADQKDRNGKAENVPPGTVVDSAIVTRSLFDFFLCSHVGIQGTSRPCRYFVLHDENNFDMNRMQLLSHYLCHLYARCPRSVSYPAPAYYAHLAAFRGRDYIRTSKASSELITSYEIELHEKIKNKMFFN